MAALHQAKKSHPKGRWWIKADATDVRKGLRESTRGVWAGDEDFGDGSMTKLYDEYQCRYSLVNSLHVGYSVSTAYSSLSTSVDSILTQLRNDITFLVSGEQQSKLKYNAALLSRASDSSLMALAWDHVGYEELIKSCKCLIEEANSPHESCPSIRAINSFKSRLLKYLKDLYSKKRVVAGYVLVFMIADELRNMKPYAVPIQFITYSSITDSKLRDLAEDLENAMTSIGMIVVGQ